MGKRTYNFSMKLPAVTRSMLKKMAETLVRTTKGSVRCGAVSMNNKSTMATANGAEQSQRPILPSVPVPELRETVRRFLLSMKPILTTAEYNHIQQMAIDFVRPGGDGMKLQSLLEGRAKSMDNWLTQWWQDVAYLEPRDANVIYVSAPALMPREDYTGQDGQLVQASKIISGLLDYKVMIDNHSIPQDMIGNTPICIDQLYDTLCTTRIPGPNKDSILTVRPDDPRPSRHVTVVHNNHFFALQAYGTDGRPLSAKQIEGQLRTIVEQSRDKAVPVGILSSEQRDNWYKAYSRLAQDEQNKDNLESMQRSIAVLCLDPELPPGSPDPQSLAHNLIEHGLGSQHASGNRFFDKIIQLVVAEGGYWGITYEHTTAEGGSVLHLLDHVAGFMRKTQFDSQSSAEGATPVRRLDFSVPPEVEDAIEKAAKSLDERINDLHLQLFNFTDYGKDFIKGQKISPDAYIQMVYQLAFYRVHGHSTATYESGSLRQYHLGRTDTIRSCSIASHAFCQAMDDPQLSANQKASLFRDAASAHKKYTDDVMNGKGIDRHFLGLRLTALEYGLDVPSLLTDPAFYKGCQWRISTSSVSSRFGGMMGFAPTEKNGYALCYSHKPDSMIVSMGTWNSCPETDGNAIRETIRKCFLDCRDMLVEAQKGNL